VREDAPGAYPLFARLYAEGAAHLPGRDGALRALLVLIFNEWRRAGRDTGSVFASAERERLLTIIDRDPAARIHPARLARELGLTATWFARRFRRTFGSAPREWLVRHRIRRAAERLTESRAPIGDIAAEFGYGDLFLFSRQFKAVMGTSPRQWREGGANERANTVDR
jgi:AraC-like DNA-binding protein